MQAGIDIFLRDERRSNGETLRIERDKSISGVSHWLVIEAAQNGNACGLTIFGTPEQLDAFIDRLAALRTKSVVRCVEPSIPEQRAMGVE